MKVAITGTLSLGSTLYSQCLRDIMRLTLAHRANAVKPKFLVDQTSGGLLAAKLLTAVQQEYLSMESGLALAQADLIICYIENPDTDGHYEQRAYETQREDAEVYVRAAPSPTAPKSKLRRPPADPYADFKKAFSLIQRRIRPIPTRGPQVYREIELRPNGGKPWFNI